MLLPDTFSEFLRLLNEHEVRYLLIGGWAVGLHGRGRPTEDLDVFVAVSPDNADRLVTVLREFGFDVPELNATLFLFPDRITRMGVAPLRIEISTGISGVDFDECYAAREEIEVDGLRLVVISKRHLIQNKAAAGRRKDLADLDRLR